MEVSVIISARNEYPQIALTVQNIALDMEFSQIEKWEIIIVDNGSEDDTTRFYNFIPAIHGAKDMPVQQRQELRRSSRGLVTDGRLRFHYDPIYSNVGARHKAVPNARYKNVIFADAHILLKPGTIRCVLETLERWGGVVHVPIAWVGASPDRPEAGVQYTYKIGEKIWGTWNRAMVVPDEPFFIPVSGHAFLGVRKKEYLDFGGYDTHQQIYGGGENYLDTLYWLLGSNVMVDPRAMIYHLSAGRGYSYNMDSLVHNMMLTAYTLGGHKWSERILIAYMNKPGANKERLAELYNQAIYEGQEKRDFISSRQVMSLEDALGIDREHDCDGSCRGAKYAGVSPHARRVWDKRNDQLHGTHHSFVQVFDSWVEAITDPDAIAFYLNSPNQR